MLKTTPRSWNHDLDKYVLGKSMGKSVSLRSGACGPVGLVVRSLWQGLPSGSKTVGEAETNF